MKELPFQKLYLIVPKKVLQYLYTVSLNMVHTLEKTFHLHFSLIISGCTFNKHYSHTRFEKFKKNLSIHIQSPPKQPTGLRSSKSLVNFLHEYQCSTCSKSFFVVVFGLKVPASEMSIKSAKKTLDK